MKTTIELPLLPLRDVVVYPHMVIPLFVGREKSIEALEAAMTGDKQILLLAQRNPADDDPGEDALYRVGTIATVLQLLKLPDGTVKVLVEGEQRGTVERFSEVDGHCRAEATESTEYFRAARPRGGRLDAFNQRITGIDIDTRIGIRGRLHFIGHGEILLPNCQTKTHRVWWVETENIWVRGF